MNTKEEKKVEITIQTTIQDAEIQLALKEFKDTMDEAFRKEGLNSEVKIINKPNN